MLPGFNTGFQDRSTIGNKESQRSPIEGTLAPPAPPTKRQEGTCSLLPPALASLVKASQKFKAHVI